MKWLIVKMNALGLCVRMIATSKWFKLVIVLFAMLLVALFWKVDASYSQPFTLPLSSFTATGSEWPELSGTLQRSVNMVRLHRPSKVQFFPCRSEECEESEIHDLIVGSQNKFVGVRFNLVENQGPCPIEVSLNRTQSLTLNIALPQKERCFAKVSILSTDATEISLNIDGGKQDAMRLESLRATLGPGSEMQLTINSPERNLPIWADDLILTRLDGTVSQYTDVLTGNTSTCRCSASSAVTLTHKKGFGAFPTIPRNAIDGLVTTLPIQVERPEKLLVNGEKCERLRYDLLAVLGFILGILAFLFGFLEKTKCVVQRPKRLRDEKRKPIEAELSIADAIEDESYVSTVTTEQPQPPGIIKKIRAEEVSLRGARNLPDILATDRSVEVIQSSTAGASLQNSGVDENSRGRKDNTHTGGQQ